MSLATNLRATVERLVAQYGEDAILSAVTVTDVPASGTVTTSTSNTSLKAVLVRRGKEFATEGVDIALRFAQGGSRVLIGSEEVLLAAADVSTAPKPGDTFAWGTSETAETRRRVVDFEVYRVQGSDLAYAVGLER
jgi:hypothetical protein